MGKIKRDGDEAEDNPQHDDEDGGADWNGGVRSAECGVRSAEWGTWASEKLQAPSSKLQRISKHQAPSGGPGRGGPAGWNENISARAN